MLEQMRSEIKENQLKIEEVMEQKTKSTERSKEQKAQKDSQEETLEENSKADNILAQENEILKKELNNLKNLLSEKQLKEDNDP